MKQFISAIPVLLAVVYAGQAQAVTFAEISDAGDNLNTAQVIQSGAFSLDSISGNLFENDADLFQIFLTGNQTFSATTRNAQTEQIPIDDLLGIPTELVADPQLFLFDSAGRGVYANDDSFGSLQPTLSSLGFSPSEAGIYYLAISSSGYNPGKLFNVSHEAIRLWEENGKLKQLGWERVGHIKSPVKYRQLAYQ